MVELDEDVAVEGAVNADVLAMEARVRGPPHQPNEDCVLH